MRRIDTLNKATDLFGSGKHGWKNGTPGTGDRPTEGKAEWFNSVQEEVSGTIEFAGDVLAPAQSDQLRKAIQKLAGQLNNNAAFVITGDGVNDVSAQVTAANAAGRPVRFVGVAHIGVAVTLTVPIVDAVKQIFSTTSQITIDNGHAVRPEWFGASSGNIMRAVDSLPAVGGEVRLDNHRYPPSYSGITPANVVTGTAVAGVDYLAKAGVTIVGSGRPLVAADGNSLINGSGTIVEGPFYVHASNCEFSGFGVDSGLTVCNARYAGAAKDGFAAIQINQTTPAFWSGSHFDELIGLCAAPSSAVHAMLIEAGDGFSMGDLYGRRGIHGVVLKASNWRARLLDGYECNSNPVIIKSDSYAPTNFFQVDKIQGRGGTDTAVRIQPLMATMGGGEIGSIICRDSPVGLSIDGGFVASSINIKSLQTHGCPKGIRRVIETRGVSIGRAVINNASVTAFEDVSATVAYPFAFGKLECLLCAAGVTTNGVVVIDEYMSSGTSGFDVNFTAGTGRVLIGMARRTSPAQAAISNLNPALGSGWANFGGTRSTFDVQLDGYGYRLKGLLTPGAVNSTICTLPANMRPVQDVLLAAGGLNSGAMVPIFIEVLAASGVVKVANHNLVTIPSGVNLDGLLIPGSYN